MMKQVLAGALVVVMLSSPASAQSVRIEVSPEVGKEATVAPGEAVYSFSRVYTIAGAKTGAESRPTGWFGLGGKTVPAGSSLVSVRTNEKYKACVPAEGTFEPQGPCFIDDDGDGEFERTSFDVTAIATKLKQPLPYSLSDIEVRREDSLRRVILYQGATADSLKFSYREFNFDLARPAFTEEISVPREALPAMVRIKSMLIEVLSVTGMGLQYRMVHLAE